MWFPRDMASFLVAEVRQRPVVLVTGSRQTGKTSLLEHTFPNHQYVSLDLPSVAEEAENSGESFLARHRTPMIIDEIQYAPRLFRYLKAAVDARRNERGLYVLTGSQKFELMAGVTDSLAGRVSIVELHSLSLREIEAHRKRPLTGAEFLEWMWRGGYPDLVARSLDPRRFYSDYVATYLERDVRQLVNVREVRDFDRFLRLCAMRTGQLLSMNDLASDVGKSPHTIKAWLAVLETSNVIRLVQPWYRNLGKRLVKSPKLYFLDTGLAAFLCGFDSAAALKASAMLGAFWETTVFGQLVRHYANRGEPTPIHFYRDHHGVEVDFVIPVGEKLRLLEAKWSETPSTDVKGFRDVETLVGSKNVILKSIVVPRRGHRKVEGVHVDDAVDFASLS